MVVMDVIFSGGGPTLRASKAPTGLKVGGGPAPARGRGSSDALLDAMAGVAERHDSPVQVVAAPVEFRTGLDYLAEAGSGMVSLNVPLRYMHSAVEVVDAGDVEVVAELVAVFPTGLDARAWDELGRIHGMMPDFLSAIGGSPRCEYEL